MKAFQQVAESTSIKSFSFDDETKILTVEFRSGSEYIYTDVPVDVADGLWTAESKGKYFSANIKDKYATEKLSGVSINPPRPFPTHGSDVAAAWPFPTGLTPVDGCCDPALESSEVDDFLKWTEEEGQEFLDVLNNPK